jgi:cysteine desulfuration protein SufE
MNIEDRQKELLDDFSTFTDWSERYQYLIDLGRQLPALDQAHKIDDNLLHGCQSKVWMIAGGHPCAMRYQADSDSVIVKGLIAVMLRVYDGQPAADVAAASPTLFLDAIGLRKHLSPTRNNGLAAMWEKMYAAAAKLA